MLDWSLSDEYKLIHQTLVQGRHWRVVDVYYRCGFRMSDVVSYKQALKLWPCDMDFNLPKHLKGSLSSERYDWMTE